MTTRSPAPTRDAGPGAEQARQLAAYERRYPLTHPAHNVNRIAGRRIRRHAQRHFRGRLLDIGCGEKPKVALVSDLVSEHVGLDHEDTLHDQSRIDLYGTAYDIPVPDASYDSVLCTAVLEHLEEPARALREAHRVLRPAGTALYTAPLFWHVHEEPRDFYRYTEHGLRHLFESAGLEVVEIEALSGFWITAAAEVGYYMSRFRRGPLKWLVKGVVAMLNLTAPVLDRGPLLDRRFTWMYLVVARRPASDASA